jgi:hypothetical protein
MNNKISLTQGQLENLVQMAYISGGHDQQEDCFQWCKQGSKERAEELLEEWFAENDVVLF